MNHGLMIIHQKLLVQERSKKVGQSLDASKQKYYHVARLLNCIVDIYIFFNIIIFILSVVTNIIGNKSYELERKQA